MFLDILKTRFTENPTRHPNMEWADVAARIASSPEKLIILQEMEDTGGEPDVIGRNEKGEYFFVDCSPESPSGRRSLCYDRSALDARKTNKPKNSVEDMAREIGIVLLTKEEYHHLQTLGKFDQKTSSWIQTPEYIRALGGALFGDRRYETVFTYHNGADSYYAARGFRGKIEI